MRKILHSLRAGLTSAPASLSSPDAGDPRTRRSAEISNYDIGDCRSLKVSARNGNSKGGGELHTKLDSLRALRDASSRPYDWEESHLECGRVASRDQAHALKALAVATSQCQLNGTTLDTQPRRIPPKLHALRASIASAPASLHGNLHSICYESLFRSGDISSRRPRLDARALRLRSRNISSSAWPRASTQSGISSSPDCHRPPRSGNRRPPRPPYASVASRGGVRSAPSSQSTVSHDSYRLQASRLRGSNWQMDHARPFIAATSALARPVSAPADHQSQAQHFGQQPMVAPSRRRPTKAVSFNCQSPTPSPYNCRMSNRVRKSGHHLASGSPARRLAMQEELNGPQQLQSSSRKGSTSGGSYAARARARNPSMLLHQDAHRLACDMGTLEEELAATQAWCARLGRSLQHQKMMLRLIKRSNKRPTSLGSAVLSDIKTLANPMARRLMPT